MSDKNTYNILVVDDISDWCITIAFLLKDVGFKCTSASSFQDAILLLEKYDYDLALLDLRLDETDEENADGLRLAKTIRNRWPEVRIAIVTGYGTTEILQELMTRDVYGKRLVENYLFKGDTDRLVIMVQYILTNR